MKTDALPRRTLEPSCDVIKARSLVTQVFPILTEDDDG